MDIPRKNPGPKSKSRCRKPSTASDKAMTSSSDFVAVRIERRSGACQKTTELQHVLCKHENITTSTYFITCHLEKEKSSRPIHLMKMPKPSSGKHSQEPVGGEDDDENEESDFEFEGLSGSDEERELVIRNGRKRLEELLAETTSLVNNLEKMENDVQRLQDEKVTLLEGLLACEGLAVRPYPPFRPLTRKIKIMRTVL